MLTTATPKSGAVAHDLNVLCPPSRLRQLRHETAQTAKNVRLLPRSAASRFQHISCVVAVPKTQFGNQSPKKRIFETVFGTGNSRPSLAESGQLSPRPPGAVGGPMYASQGTPFVRRVKMPADETAILVVRDTRSRLPQETVGG